MVQPFANKLNKYKNSQDSWEEDDGWDFYIYLDEDDEREKGIYNKNTGLHAFDDTYFLDDDGDDDNGKRFKKSIIFYLFTGCLFTGCLFTVGITAYLSRGSQLKDVITVSFWGSKAV